MITIEELLTSSTEDEILDGFLSSLESMGIPARSWRKGGTARSILVIVAALYAAFTVLMVTIAQAGFLPTAVGGWLTILARYVYGVERITARYATGTVTLTNVGGGVYTYAAGAFIVVNSTTGKSYANVSGFTLNAGPTSLDVDVQALELGSASNSPPTKIDALNTALTGVSVSNAAAVIGQDEENDEDLRGRCRDALGALSPNGPRGAYRYAISVATLAGGAPTNVNRARISPFSSTGRVDIVLASASGAVTSDDITAVLDSIETIARPDTDTVSVVSATTIPDTRTLTIWAKKTKGIDAAAIQTAADNALIFFIEHYPIGGRTKIGDTQGYLFVKSIEEAADAAYDGISDADRSALQTVWLVECTGTDLPLSSTQVATLVSTIIVRITEDVG